MTLKECYEAMGSDYADVLGRLQSEALVRRFALKFLNDASFTQLETAFAARDRETAFRAAHTLKGVCANLGFTALGVSSNALTEALRSEWTAEADGLYTRVAEDYHRTVDAIRALDA